MNVVLLSTVLSDNMWGQVMLSARLILKKYFMKNWIKLLTNFEKTMEKIFFKNTFSFKHFFKMSLKFKHLNVLLDLFISLYIHNFVWFIIYKNVCT